MDGWMDGKRPTKDLSLLKYTSFYHGYFNSVSLHYLGGLVFTLPNMEVNSPLGFI
jgi:hypothetical protein